MLHQQKNATPTTTKTKVPWVSHPSKPIKTKQSNMEAMQDGSETKWWTDGKNVNLHGHEMDVEKSDEKET